MAIMWNGSLIPWLDPNGAPYSGAKAYFFNAGTTTPRTVYQDSGLGISHDHPVLANANGMFPAIFLPAGDYRLRITDADNVTIWDVDGISTPSTGDSGGGGGGDTPIELLARTGDVKARYDTGSHSGWVRVNGRTIGDASSGATERASADCEDLFLHLWGKDPTLVVSGGRGGNAASDWAASKTIAMPDGRQRAFIGMASMGASAATLIPAALFDGGENGDTLGATVGAGEVALTEAQLAEHDHAATTDTAGAHAHNYEDRSTSGSGGGFGGGGQWGPQTDANRTTQTGGAHNHGVSVANAGEGDPHPNVQPSMVVTLYMKL